MMGDWPLSFGRNVPRSLVSIALRIVAIGVVVIALTSPAAAATLTVDDDRAQCGNADYSSIQTAVQNANSGDRIEVCPGTYNESVTVGMSDLRIVGNASSDTSPGAASDAPVLDSRNANTSAFNISAGVSNVTIEEFEMLNYTSTGIRATGGEVSDITIRNISVDGLTTGVLAEQQSDVTYEDWKISHGNFTQSDSSSIDVALRSGPNGVISNISVVESNFNFSSSSGVLIAPGPDSRTQNISIRDSDFDVESQSVYLDVSDSSLSNVTVTDFEVSGSNLNSSRSSDGRVYAELRATDVSPL